MVDHEISARMVYEGYEADVSVVGPDTTFIGHRSVSNVPQAPELGCCSPIGFFGRFFKKKQRTESNQVPLPKAPIVAKQKWAMD